MNEPTVPSADHRVLDDATKAAIRLLCRRLLLMIVEVAAVCVVAAVHKVLDFVASYVFREGYEEIARALRVSFAAGFSIIYLRQVYDMVLIFVPSLHGKPKQMQLPLNLHDKNSRGKK